MINILIILFFLLVFEGLIYAKKLYFRLNNKYLQTLAIIQLIACPRTLSTALMYSFAQRKDMDVVDEPFYANYLTRTGKEHPGREDILKAQSVDIHQQIQSFEKTSKEHLFIKNIAHHIQKLDLNYLNEYRNILYLRDPRRILTSISKIIPNPTLLDIGIEVQFKVMKSLQREGRSFVVLNSSDLLAKPIEMLYILCHHLNIPFDEAMLSWPAGPKPYDGIWAKHWYSSVHKTTEFGKENISQDPLPAHLEDLCAEATFYYNQIIPHALKID